MAKELRLELLGGLRVTLDGLPVRGFVSSKVKALLVYLAVTGRPQHRSTLAGLLWGELPEKKARTNLRQALTNLRRLVGDHLLADRSTVALNPDAPIWLDVKAFEALTQQQPAGPAGDVSRLQQASDLYRGDFLDGFVVREAAAFDEWVLTQRERLRQLAVHALDDLARAHAARGEGAAVRRDLERLVTLDPWREDAQRQLMRQLAVDGQRTAALARFAVYRQLLEDELGIEPEPETTALYERLLTGADLPAFPVAGAPDVTLQPMAWHTPFVGREVELARIASLLADPACRLLTLVGPGGSGKTRLALRAVADLRAAFADGVYVVPLASINEPAFIAPAIAGMLGIAFSAGETPEAQLLRELRDKRLLLVLDNLEHLIQGVRLLQAILDAAPGVSILTTSRERLALRAEWLLPVRGLSLAEDDREASIADSSAAQLFVARARQLRPDFALTPENGPAVARICRLVEGLPLGIELAAAWVRTHTCDEIADEAERSLDFLATSIRDMPERHRNLRTVFDHSWSLLPEPEQVLLRQLVVFRGGFRQEAARAIAGASPERLASLVDRSLVHRGPAGRYVLHELLRQYAAERLAASDEGDATRDRHAAWYAAFLDDRVAALKGARQAVTLRAIEAEIDNVRAAWDWAVARGQPDIVGQALDGLSWFYELRNWWVEGLTTLEQAIANLTERWGGDDVLSPERGILLGRLLGWQAYLAYRVARFEQAEAAVRRGLGLLRRRGADDLVLAMSLSAQARVAADALARHAEARRLYLEVLEVFRRRGDAFGVGMTLNALAGAAFEMGDYAEATERWQESLAVRRSISDSIGVGNTLNNLGEMAWIMGEYAEAESRARDSLAWFRKLGRDALTMHPLNVLGGLARVQGEYDESRCLHREAVAICRGTGDRRILALMLNQLAEAEACSGNLSAARDLVTEALMISRETGFRRGMTVSLTRQARLACRRHAWLDARRLAEESLAVARDVNARHEVCDAQIVLGRAAMRLGDITAARNCFAGALQLAGHAGIVPLALNAVVGMATACVAGAQSDGTECLEQAGELLTFALRQPALWHETRVEATRLLEELAERLPAATLAAARNRGSELSLDDVRDAFSVLPAASST